MPTAPLTAVSSSPHEDGREVALGVLGDLRVSGPDGTFEPGAARPGAVLALLAIHAGECVSVDRIVEELWAAGSEAPAVKRVQVNVLRLRRGLAAAAAALDPAALVRTHSCGYSLEIDPDRIDAGRFARLVARGRAGLDAGDALRASATVREALALWRGDPYGEFVYESFAVSEIRRLEELRACATETWVEAELALGAHAIMVPEIGRLVDRHPLRERLRALHMLALYRCRRQSDALAAYHDARRALLDGLGIEPGFELRALERAILRQSPELEDRGAGANLLGGAPQNYAYVA